MYIATAFRVLRLALPPMPTLDDLRSYTLSAPRPHRLVLDVPGVHVIIQGDDTDEVTVAVESNAPSDRVEALLRRLNLALRLMEGTVHLQTDRHQQHAEAAWWRRQRHPRPPLTLRIQVPRSTQADVHAPDGAVNISDIAGPLTIDGAGSAIALRDVSGRLTIQAAGGSVKVSQFRGSLLSVKSTGHAVALQDITADEMQVCAASASVQLEEIDSSLTLDTHGSTTHAHALSGTVTGHVHGGRCVLHLPPASTQVHAPGADFTMHLAHPCEVRVSAQSVVNKSTRSWETQTPHHISGGFRGGGPVVQTHAPGGRVTLRAE